MEAIKQGFAASENMVQVLRLEATMIESVAARLDLETAQSAVNCVVECPGKLIVIGVGKSGVIAQKIAQTFTSTGTVAIFLHPSDALHGSLGVISAGDVVIALSNSGETDEILSMLPTLKDRGVKLLSIVGNVGSTLSNASDVVLDASVEKEACPLNLAPTTSTTVALALGDALAMAVMAARGLTENDFAANHPAGRLGRRLTLRVEALMHESPNIKPDAGWLEVVGAISKYALGAVNVVDNSGALVGIVTDGDLRRTIERSDSLALDGLNAEQMMTAQPITVAAGTLAFDALKLMEQRSSQISVLPVVDEQGHCVGLIRLHDIVRSGL